MSKRINIYFNQETNEKLEQIKEYLVDSSALPRQQKINSAALVMLIDTFYKLFLENDGRQNYFERLSQLEKNFAGSQKQMDGDLKLLHQQMDQLLYLELTNFHAITKGEEFDVQNLESIHSRMDPQQHELMARIKEVIQEDKARGKTMKYSH